MSHPGRTIETLESPVLENRDVGAGHGLARLGAPWIASRARPGQFLTVGLPGRTDPLLPRPFAVFDADAGSGEIAILYRVVGRGTRLLAGTRAGDAVRLVGPLGRGWRKPKEWRRPKEGPAVLVAGGTAWAALRFLAKELASEGLELCAVWGQAGARGFPDREAVGAPGVQVKLATDDGSCGFQGTAIECLRALLNDDLSGREPTLYGAGPEPMLARLAGLARDRGLPCQVSLEARMACGIGVCRGCVVNAREPHPETGLRRRAVCTDGPVFDSGELDWGDLR